MPKYSVTLVFEAETLVDALAEIMYPAGEQTATQFLDVYAHEEE